MLGIQQRQNGDRSGMNDNVPLNRFPIRPLERIDGHLDLTALVNELARHGFPFANDSLGGISSQSPLIRLRNQLLNNPPRNRGTAI